MVSILYTTVSGGRSSGYVLRHDIKPVLAPAEWFLLPLKWGISMCLTRMGVGHEGMHQSYHIICGENKYTLRSGQTASSNRQQIHPSITSTMSRVSRSPQDIF